MNRRFFLRASGVTIGLPFFEAMIPKGTRAAESAFAKRRMVAINVGLGLHIANIIPEKSGIDYAITPYLKPIENFRNQYTVISGISHPGVDGGHSAEKSFLTATPHPGSSSFKKHDLPGPASRQSNRVRHPLRLPFSQSGRPWTLLVS